jgi:hypothetical protein
MPAKDRLGANGSVTAETAPPDRLSFDRQAAPNLVGESELPALQLIFQNAVLFEQIIDHRLLLAVHRTCYHAQEKGSRWVHRRHDAIFRKPLSINTLALGWNTTGYRLGVLNYRRGQ